MEKDRKYCYEKDIKGLDVYDKIIEDSKDKDKDKWIYHYDVLPHAFFGDISKANILFLAKNPSYAKYDDEYDDWLYLENFATKHPNEEFNLEIYKKEYEDDLKKVSFFEDFKKNYNKCFYTTWKWWNSKVINGAKCKIDSDKVAFVNISGYQSMKYKAHKYTEEVHQNNWFGSSMEKSELINKMNDPNVCVIVVWGKEEWSEFLTEKKNVDFFEEKKEQGKFIVLNQFQKINSIYSILDNKEEYIKKNIYNETDISLLEKYFEK